MTEERKDGGAAFPQMRVWNADRAEYEDTQQYPGMSLRDWFAGQVLASAITWGGEKGIADRAYAIADAMIAKRRQ